MKGEKNALCLKRPWAGTYKAKCFSCRQKNAGESARDEPVRKYSLPVNTSKVLPLWQPQLQMIQPTKHCTQAAPLAHSAPVSCAVDPTCPSRTFWISSRGRSSFKPRKIRNGNVAFRMQGQADVEATAKEKFSDSFRHKTRNTGWLYFDEMA